MLWRERRKFAVTVQGDVVDGIQGPTVTYRVWPKLAELQKAHAAGLLESPLPARWRESSKEQGSIVVPACR